jgi:hypothetical protein
MNDNTISKIGSKKNLISLSHSEEESMGDMVDLSQQQKQI